MISVHLNWFIIYQLKMLFQHCIGWSPSALEFKPEVGTLQAPSGNVLIIPSPSGNSYIRVYQKYIADHAKDMTVYTDMTVESLIGTKTAESSV